MESSMKSWQMLLLILLLAVPSPTAFGYQIAEAKSDNELRRLVMRSIRDGTSFLRSRQDGEGSWGKNEPEWGSWVIGKTALSVLTLINCDVPVESASVQRGLQFLRSLPSHAPSHVYEVSLTIMALCAAEEYDRDRVQITRLTRALEKAQQTIGVHSGGWDYRLTGNSSSDRSNSQYAVLALRDAAYAGVRVDQGVWRRTQEHWLNGQERDGGWPYRPDQPQATGSMTAAGLSTLAITSRMLFDDSDVDETGQVDCCTPHPPLEAFERGRRWMAERFSVMTNPVRNRDHYYYLYGLERAGRLSNVRFFGEHDWYREGARYFVAAQHGDGSWLEPGTSRIVSTCFGLLFLSKGLSRVVVNKLDYISAGREDRPDGDWNRHPRDVSNLVEVVDGLEGWPPRLTSQVLTLNRLGEATAVANMNQAPVLFIGGKHAPELTDQHIRWLREYVDEGGFIFAVANCGSGTFDTGIREIVSRMFPDGEGFLKRLQPDHPVYRSQYPLDAETTDLQGVDFGCRTSIIYSPEDISCLWHKWMRHDPPKRHESLIQQIIRANRVGVNVLAYATGREPPVKLTDHVSTKKATSDINRNLTEIAQLRHSGGWDTAPKALPNLLQALEQTAGMSVSQKRRTIPVTLSELQRFPIAYMHGRYQFDLSVQERDALRDYLTRGAVLFADACCGATKFDRSFREVIAEVFPDHELKKIPADHEMFTEIVGHNLKTVKLRRLVPGGQGQTMQARTEETPPLFEGIEIDGRYAVIYSQYDLSCALENQASLGCDGYEKDDAMKLATNIVLYAMLQDISWKSVVERSRGQQ